MDRPPINIDNDEEHHKTLIHKQSKNYWGNDTSKIFMSIPIVSTIAVQWEDGGPWTHGTVVDKGNHNHHNRSYKIQVTKTGRIITPNRKHIRPTPLTAENFLHNQFKHTYKNRSTIHHSGRYSKTSTATYNQTHNKWKAKQQYYARCKKEANSTQDTTGEQRGEEDMIKILHKKHRNDGEKIVRTRCTRIVKKTQTGWCMNGNTKTFAQANMSDTVQKSNALLPFQHKRNTFFGFLTNWLTTWHASL